MTEWIGFVGLRQSDDDYDDLNTVDIFSILSSDGLPGIGLDLCRGIFFFFSAKCILSFPKRNKTPPPDIFFNMSGKTLGWVLTPCDFFLWGYLKDKVFTSPPRDINDVRARIMAEVEALREQKDIVQNAVRGMRSRAEVCVARFGGHVEGHWG